jgi:hypothetical protein
MRSLFRSEDRRDKRNAAMHGIILHTIENDVTIQDRGFWSPLGPIGY